MTETMIDLPEAIAKSDDADFLRELIQDAAQRLMDIEVAAVCGAGHGERSSDRENQRNGYRPRQWDTRSELRFAVPRTADGGHLDVHQPLGGVLDHSRRKSASSLLAIASENRDCMVSVIVFSFVVVGR